MHFLALAGTGRSRTKYCRKDLFLWFFLPTQFLNHTSSTMSASFPSSTNPVTGILFFSVKFSLLFLTFLLTASASHPKFSCLQTPPVAQTISSNCFFYFLLMIGFTPDSLPCHYAWNSLPLTTCQGSSLFSFGCLRKPHFFCMKPP